MKHGHGYRIWHRHKHVNTCNVQNIEHNTGVVSMSDTDTDACRIPNTPCFIGSECLSWWAQISAVLSQADRGGTILLLLKRWFTQWRKLAKKGGWQLKWTLRWHMIVRHWSLSRILRRRLAYQIFIREVGWLVCITFNIIIRLKYVCDP